MSLTLPFAVEKVLFRLALCEGGAVTLARAFLELPLSLEEVEQYADKAVDGTAMIKNAWGEFLSYEFPELQRQAPPAPPNDCPLCGGDGPPLPTEGGKETRRAVVCDGCYRKLRRLTEREPDEGVVERLRSFFGGEEEEDLRKVALAEHEIFFLGLRLGLTDFTHTSIAAQSRVPSSQLKERLDRMGARRYVHLGLLPTGDAVAYRFPPDLSYPQAHYRRLADPSGAGSTKGLAIGLDKPARGASPGRPPVTPTVKPLIRPKVSPIKITIRERRDRG